MKMDKITFLDLFRLYIKYYRETDNYWEKKKGATLNVWEDKYHIVNSYLIEIEKVKLKAIDFDVKFAKAFFAWLLKRHSHNHAVRHIEICKAVLNFGGNEAYVSANPISFYKIKREPPKKPPYLPLDKIALIENYRSGSVEKTKAQQLLVLQIHTGYDFGDFKEITRENVKIFKNRKYLIKLRHKNGIECIALLPAIVEDILEKNDYKMGLLDNPTYNLQMKKIFKELGIDIYINSKNMRKIFFGHKLNNEGYSLETTSKMGGHKHITTTQDYYVEVNINFLHNELEGKGI